jgi:hemerythrin
MKWKEEYATGIVQIDEQHKTLFRMSEDFRAALENGSGGRVYSVMLDILDTYARGHFHFEEDCMQKHRCPVSQKNKNAHQMFSTVIASYKADFAANGYHVTAATKLVNTLDDWLDGHIGNVDIHLRKCVAKANKTPKASP